MNHVDPIALFFGDMEKLGPGSNADTLHVLDMLPARGFQLVIDAGCGTGRQTMVLAKELGVPIQAIDSNESFLKSLVRRAETARLGSLVQPHCMDMKDIPRTFRDINLLWSEGAAYNIGFSNALSGWKQAVASGGFVVVSELAWLTDEPPDAAREFFGIAYPDMRSADENARIAAAAGYRLLATHTLPHAAWTEGYYDVLGPRAQAFLGHPDPMVREFAVETVKEIEVFESADDSYGYVFYVLQRS